MGIAAARQCVRRYAEDSAMTWGQCIAVEAAPVSPSSQLDVGCCPGLPVALSTTQLLERCRLHGSIALPFTALDLSFHTCMLSMSTYLARPLLSEAAGRAGGLKKK